MACHLLFFRCVGTFELLLYSLCEFRVILILKFEEKGLQKGQYLCLYLLPKPELTKIGHIFRKQSTYIKNQSFQKISLIKVDLLVKYSLQKKKIRKIRFIFDAVKLLCTNFANFEEVVHNFGWSDDDMI